MNKAEIIKILTEAGLKEVYIDDIKDGLLLKATVCEFIEVKGIMRPNYGAESVQKFIDECSRVEEGYDALCNRKPQSWGKMQLDLPDGISMGKEE